MELSGSLTNLDFAELLQMLGTAGKSGKLSVTQQRGQGLVVLRGGEIIYAASSSAREALGHMLLCRGLVTEEQLQAALGEQSASGEEVRLGTILVRQGLVSLEQLEELLYEQIQRVISELVHWRGAGHFRFEEVEILDRGEVGLETREFLLEHGLPPDQVLLESFARMEDEAAEDGGGSAVAGEAVAAAEPPAAGEAGKQQSLRSLMVELRTPAFAGEFSNQILGFAKRIAKRAAILSLSPLGYRGLAQFGFHSPGDCGHDFVRAIELPLTREIVLHEAIERKSVFVGPVPANGSNRRLVDALGTEWPEQVVVAPLIVSGRVLQVVYGDGLLTGDAASSLEDLELLMLHAGLAMERDLLEKRIRHYESLRSDS